MPYLMTSPEAISNQLADTVMLYLPCMMLTQGRGHLEARRPREAPCLAGIPHQPVSQAAQGEALPHPDWLDKKVGLTAEGGTSTTSTPPWVSPKPTLLCCGGKQAPSSSEQRPNTEAWIQAPPVYHTNWHSRLSLAHQSLMVCHKNRTTFTWRESTRPWPKR